MAERDRDRGLTVLRKRVGTVTVQIDSRTGVVIAVSCGLCLDLQQIFQVCMPDRTVHRVVYVLVSGRHSRPATTVPRVHRHLHVANCES